MSCLSLFHHWILFSAFCFCKSTSGSFFPYASIALWFQQNILSYAHHGFTLWECVPHGAICCLLSGLPSRRESHGTAHLWRESWEGIWSGGDWSVKGPAIDQLNSCLETKERDLGLCDQRTVPGELTPSPSQQLSHTPSVHDFLTPPELKLSLLLYILLSPFSWAARHLFYVTGGKAGKGCALI